MRRYGRRRANENSDGNPYGTANLDSSLTSLQAYDVSLFLHLPRTPNNLAAGNFMLNISLLSPAKGASTAETLQPTDSPASMRVLAQSRRPAILTYASPIIDAASTLTGLPWYVLGWKRESEVLEVGMLEGVEFPKGWTNVPRSVYVAVEADEKMQFYEVGVKIIARFGGIRYVSSSRSFRPNGLFDKILIALTAGNKGGSCIIIGFYHMYFSQACFGQAL